MAKTSMNYQINISNYERLNSKTGVLENGYSFIYAIVDSLGNVKYVGKTINLKNRIKQHLKALETGKTKIYRWMKKHFGKFEFIIIDICENSKWEKIEKFYISFFLKIGVNLLNHQEGGQGIQPNAKFSDSTKHKLSISAKKRVKKFNHSEKYELMYAKLSKGEIKQVFELKYEKGLSCNEIAEIFNSTPSTIWQIINGKRYKSISKKLIVEYQDNNKTIFEIRKSNIIKDFLENKIEINEVILKYNIHRVTFFRYFKEIVGVNFRNYEFKR